MRILMRLAEVSHRSRTPRTAAGAFSVFVMAETNAARPAAALRFHDRHRRGGPVQTAQLAWNGADVGCRFVFCRSGLSAKIPLAILSGTVPDMGAIRRPPRADGPHVYSAARCRAAAELAARSADPAFGVAGGNEPARRLRTALFADSGSHLDHLSHASSDDRFVRATAAREGRSPGLERRSDWAWGRPDYPAPDRGAPGVNYPVTSESSDLQRPVPADDAQIQRFL